MSEKFESSISSGAHFQLSRLAGNWEGEVKTWFEPTTVADASPIKGIIRPILDGRFVMHEYSGSFGGKPLEGIAIYGFHLALGKFQSIWLDSFHNGSAMMFSEGKRGDNNVNVLGSYAYVTPEMEQHWGWRTEIDIVNNDEIIITAYNISPEGNEVKATQINYRRVL